MRESLLQHLVCPQDHANLELTATDREGDRIKTGELKCSSCGQRWPIKDFIPRFVKDDDYVKSFSVEWNTFARTQLDSVNGSGESLNYFQQVTGRVPADFKGQLLLDAGCGTGRFLELFDGVDATVIGIDLSYAVDTAIENCGRMPNVQIVQASIFELPFRPNSFDFVYSIGVLHHTPDPPRALASLTELVKPGNEIAVRVLEPRTLGGVNVDYLFPLYLFRQVTKRMPPDRLLRFLRWYVPIAWKLRRLPVVGLFFRWLFSVEDVRGSVELSKEHAEEWGVLNTFDRFSPWYYYRTSWPKLEKWFRNTGLVDVTQGRYATSGYARKPGEAASAN